MATNARSAVSGSSDVCTVAPTVAQPRLQRALRVDVNGSAGMSLVYPGVPRRGAPTRWTPGS